MSRKVAKSNGIVGANACQVCCFVTFRHSLLCRSSYLIPLNVCFWNFNFFKLIYCDAPLEAQSTGVLAIISTAVIVIVSGLRHHHLQFQGFTRFEAQKKRPSGPREDQHFLLFCTMFANKFDEKKRKFSNSFPHFPRDVNLQPGQATGTHRKNQYRKAPRLLPSEAGLFRRAAVWPGGARQGAQITGSCQPENTRPGQNWDKVSRKLVAGRPSASMSGEHTFRGAFGFFGRWGELNLLGYFSSANAGVSPPGIAINLGDLGRRLDRGNRKVIKLSTSGRV